MLNSELALNSQLFPEGMRRDYDAHVYYSAQTRPLADALRARAEAEFRGKPVFVGRMVDERVGPHPHAMFEINFPREIFTEVLCWLMKERGELCALVHEVTGDDPRDHSLGALW